jgi:hypothetical protein
VESCAPTAVPYSASHSPLPVLQERRVEEENDPGRGGDQAAKDQLLQGRRKILNLYDVLLALYTCKSLENVGDQNEIERFIPAPTRQMNFHDRKPCCGAAQYVWLAALNCVSSHFISRLLRESAGRHLTRDETEIGREGSGVTSKLEHLEAYSSTAKKAMDGLVSKLRTFKYIPSCSRQSVLRNPLGKRLPNTFPR